MAIKPGKKVGFHACKSQTWKYSWLIYDHIQFRILALYKGNGFLWDYLFLQIYKYKYSKFKLNRTFDWILIIKVVNSSSNISFQIFWCFTHSILSYREFVCSSPGATPFHYAAIDSLSQYTQTKFFYQSLRKIWKSGGRGHIVMGWGLPPWFYRVKARNMCKIISLVPSKKPVTRKN